MPPTVTLTEEAVLRLAPDDKAVKTARDLVRKRSFSQQGVSADGTWILARCQGSAIYELSVDLAVDSAPVGRCTCPSRKFPCKHVLGLMLAYATAPETFTEREPPEELLAKRAKSTARAEKADKPKAPRKVNHAAQAKKAAAQRDGLELLEKLVLDLVAGGQWFAPARLERLDRQAKQMSDAYLPGALVMLRRLALLGQRKGVHEEQRAALASELIGRLWATVQKGRNYLDNKLSGDEVQAEADAVIEEVLGRAWQLTELREKGHLRQDLQLLELAYERTEDDARQERIETSYLLELGDGTIFQAITYRPFRGINQIPGQASYAQPLRVPEAAIYPGFLNRRIRWDAGSEQVQTLGPAHLQRGVDLAAREFDKVVATFRQQLKHPLAPREAVMLVRCRQIGTVDERVVLEDAQGRRIEASSRGAANHVANLVRAAGMLTEPAVLVRLFVAPLANSVVAEPLAALTSQHHLRLGV